MDGRGLFEVLLASFTKDPCCFPYVLLIAGYVVAPETVDDPTTLMYIYSLYRLATMGYTGKNNKNNYNQSNSNNNNLVQVNNTDSIGSNNNQLQTINNNRWVINLSKTSLTKGQKAALAKALIFL